MARNTTVERSGDEGAASEEEIWRWLAGFAASVRRRDFAAGRVLFEEDCHGFGTVAKQVGDLDALVKKQWAFVWPRTSGFRFLRRGSRIVASADASLVVVMVRWQACNHAAPRTLVYDRRGRATMLLRREMAGTGGNSANTWRAVHTHFSFDPPVIPKPASRPKPAAGRGRSVKAGPGPTYP